MSYRTLITGSFLLSLMAFPLCARCIGNNKNKANMTLSNGAGTMLSQPAANKISSLSPMSRGYTKGGNQSLPDVLYRFILQLNDFRSTAKGLRSPLDSKQRDELIRKIRRFKRKVEDTLQFYLPPENTLLYIGSQMVTGPNLPIFASPEIVYSNGYTGIDIGYQSLHGATNFGNTLGHQSIDGDVISLAVSLLPHEGTKFIKDDMAANTKLRASLCSEEKPLFQPMFTGDPEIDELLNSTSSEINSLNSLKPYRQSGQLVTFVEEKRKSGLLFNKFINAYHLLTFANYHYLRPIGGYWEAGLSLSKFIPYKQARFHKGVTALVNIRGIWTAPSEAISKAYMLGQQSDIRLNFAVYWQDRAPYLDKTKPDKPLLIANRWSTQVGFEYKPTNILDDGDSYDAFLRTRSLEGVEPQLGVSIGRGTDKRLFVGVNVGLTFDLTYHNK